MFLSGDTICIAAKLALYRWKGTENNSNRREASRACLSVSLSHLDPPVRSQSLSEDLLLVGEFVAEQCVRGCHIKCECFPLSNLITDFYGGISLLTERQGKRIVIGLFSFKVIYGICGIITARGNGLRTTETLTCSDWFNVCSSGGICTILTWDFPSVVLRLVRHYRVAFSAPHNYSSQPSREMEWLKTLSSQ